MQLPGGMETVPSSVFLRTPRQTTFLLGSTSFLSLIVRPKSFIKAKSDSKDAQATLVMLTPNIVVNVVIYMEATLMDYVMHYIT